MGINEKALEYGTYIVKEVKAPSNYILDTNEYTINELSQYLPKQMSEVEVIEIIKKLKETETNTGKLIGLTVKEVGNRFDKSKIAALVKSV